MKPFEIDRSEYRKVGKVVPKKDAERLLLGEPAYMDDFAPKDCLIIKLVRSKYAHAIVQDVDFSEAMEIPGIVAVYTYKDVPNHRFTTAGQSYPEPSPHDRLILDRHVRFVGDPVAMVVGENEKAVDMALELVKVDYEVLPPVLDFHKALDNEVVIHPEEDWTEAFQAGDNKRNLIHTEEHVRGDVDKVLSECDVTVDRTFRTKANHQGYMETMRAFCEVDSRGRLHCVTSNQIVFHTRRILSEALCIPKSQIHVEKLRIGGGFGAKQTVNNEIFAAFAAWKLKKPCKIIYSRSECLTAGSPRHEMEIRVRVGAMKDGTIRAIDMTTLSNGGAYGEHSTATIGLSGHKTLPLYTTTCEAARFHGDVVYTNVSSAGAYRGFGATQGTFALESCVNELAGMLNLDPMEMRLRSIVREGMVMPDYFGEKLGACALDQCIAKCAENFGWKEKYPVRDMGNGKVRAAGMAITMQGSCISGIDVASCRLALMDDGSYIMTIGAADMGTGCDTILSQMAAEVLECDLDAITVMGADTDISPYDSGSYASSTTYLTGMATANAAKKLRENICRIGANLLGAEVQDVDFNGQTVVCEQDGRSVSLGEISYAAQCNNAISVEVTETCTSPISPPPFMASMAEIELDKGTGKVAVLHFNSVVDCGIPVNPALARVQAEGGALQGIGMALTENVTYTEDGHIMENNFLQYRMPTRLDVGDINIDFAYSYEPSHAFGVKSIGEIVINTATPAIAHAIARITGTYLTVTPFTPEKVLRALNGLDVSEHDKRFAE